MIPIPLTIVRERLREPPIARWAFYYEERLGGS
jgi:hypothetical protein